MFNQPGVIHETFGANAAEAGQSRERPNADERYLAQSVDAHEFEIRIQALERSRPLSGPSD